MYLLLFYGLIIGIKNNPMTSPQNTAAIETQPTALEEALRELAKDIAIVAYSETRDLVERRALLVLTTFHQKILTEAREKTVNEEYITDFWSDPDIKKYVVSDSVPSGLPFAITAKLVRLHAASDALWDELLIKK